MKLIAHVDHAVAFEADLVFARRLYVGATGHVATSGWSDPRLAPRFYTVQPHDGLWDFDFIASDPTGVAADVRLPIAAHYEGSAPAWLRGVRIHAADGADVVVHAITAAKAQTVAAVRATTTGIDAHVERTIAIYDDSFQPTGTIHWQGHFPPVPHVEMKKLRHELTIVADGPDEARIRHCIHTSLTAGAVAAIIAAFATGGWAAAEAFASTAVAALETSLGNSFQVKLQDRSHWTTWDS